MSFAARAGPRFNPPFGLAAILTACSSPGVEASTGWLDHGLPMSVGVALALRAKGQREQRVFVLTGDAGH